MNYEFVVGDARTLVVNVTSEGVIMDAFDGPHLVGTIGMTADEWFDHAEEVTRRCDYAGCDAPVAPNFDSAFCNDHQNWENDPEVTS